MFTCTCVCACNDVVPLCPPYMESPIAGAHTMRTYCACTARTHVNMALCSTNTLAIPSTEPLIKNHSCSSTFPAKPSVTLLYKVSTPLWSELHIIISVIAICLQEFWWQSETGCCWVVSFFDYFSLRQRVLLTPSPALFPSPPELKFCSACIFLESMVGLFSKGALVL